MSVFVNIFGLLIFKSIDVVVKDDVKDVKAERDVRDFSVQGTLAMSASNNKTGRKKEKRKRIMFREYD